MLGLFGSDKEKEKFSSSYATISSMKKKAYEFLYQKN